MQINATPIADTFAVTAARLIVTAETPAWAQTAAPVVTGYAASVICCDAEAGLERLVGTRGAERLAWPKGPIPEPSAVPLPTDMELHGSSAHPGLSPR